jgi:GLPGLI family protein
MKKAFLLLTGFASITILHAQIKEGTIFYDQKINMHRNIQDEQMKAMMPEFRTAKYQLEFSDSVSVYKIVPEDEAPDPFAGGGGGGRRVFTMNAGGSGDMYKNFSQMKSIQSTELAGKNFMIVDSIRQQPWKLGTETKQILGHSCHKATRRLTQAAGGRRIMVMNGGVTSPDTSAAKKPAGRDVEVVAWYADDIVSPAGPENYGQLPGVILQLDVDNGATVYTATEIKKTADLKNLKEPKKGKVVTQQEYTKMMMDMMGNGGMSIQSGSVRF